MDTLPTTKAENLPMAMKSLGVLDDIETSDLDVPKIFHQQDTSDFAKAGKARAGDWCDSLTGNILAKRDESLEIIIFGLYKTLIISKEDKAKRKFFYDRTMHLTPENAVEIATKAKNFIEEINGETFKNNLTYNYYCILPSRINDIPFVLSLGSTKSGEARKLNTMISRLLLQKRSEASVVFSLKSKADSNDQGDWFGVEISQARDSTPEELSAALEWHAKSKSQKFVVAEEETKTAGKSADSDDDIPF